MLLIQKNNEIFDSVNVNFFFSIGAAQETIGFEPTARSVLDTAQYWTMVLAKGFTTDGKLYQSL